MSISPMVCFIMLYFLATRAVACCTCRLSSSLFFVFGYCMNEIGWMILMTNILIVYWCFFARGAQWPGAKHCGSGRSPGLHHSELLWTESDRLGPVIAILLAGTGWNRMEKDGKGWNRNDRKIVKNDIVTTVFRRTGRNTSKLLDKLDCIDWHRSVTEAEV